MKENRIKRFNENSELNISDVMKRINSLLKEYEDLKRELSKDDNKLDHNWPTYVRRKDELENVFQILGIKYVS